MVRQRVLVPSFAGSNPAGPAKFEKQKRALALVFLLGNLAVLNDIQVRAVGARPAGFEPGSSNARFSLAKTTAHCLYSAGPAKRCINRF